MTINRDDLDTALMWLGQVDNGSGQICQLNADGKPVMILFEFGCPTCSEVASKNSEEYGNAFVLIVQAARAYLSATEKMQQLKSALTGLIGAESADELRSMEAVLRMTAAPAADKAAMIDAIQALLSTA